MIDLACVDIRDEIESLSFDFGHHRDPSSLTTLLVEPDRMIVDPGSVMSTAAVGLAATLQGKEGRRYLDLGVRFVRGPGSMFVAEPGTSTLRSIVSNPLVRWLHVIGYSDRYGHKAFAAHVSGDTLRELLGSVDVGSDVEMFASQFGAARVSTRH